MALAHRSVLVGVATLTMLAAATPALAAEPTGVIRAAGGDTAVADSYIVVFKDTAVSRNTVADNARRLVGRHGGSVARTYGAALRGFEVRVDAKAAARIAADPAVAYVEQNHTVSIAGTQTNPPSWGLDRIDQRNLPLNSSYTYPNTASNVRAYIIDTGIRFTHNDFGGRAVSGYDAIDGAPPTTATATARTSPARWAARRTGWPRACSSSASGCSTARAAAPTPRWWPASTG